MSRIEAKKIVGKFYNITYPDGYKGMTDYEAKHCALIEIEGLINENKSILGLLTAHCNERCLRAIKFRIEELKEIKKIIPTIVI